MIFALQISEGSLSSSPSSAVSSDKPSANLLPSAKLTNSFKLPSNATAGTPADRDVVVEHSQSLQISSRVQFKPSLPQQTRSVVVSGSGSVQPRLSRPVFAATSSGSGNSLTTITSFQNTSSSVRSVDIHQILVL